MAVILVADDDDGVRLLVRALLELRGHRVVTVADGSDALRVAAGAQVDLAVLDVEMPGASGYDVLEAWKADPEREQLPVVFLTARTLASDVADGLHRGAQDYLRKPFEPAELVARVESALRAGRVQQELRERNVELERLARVDPLTGVFNRRHVAEQLEALSSRARRSGSDLAVVLLDIDHFKGINDVYGHAVGDGVLRTVVTRMKGALRTEDVLGRWGGEEFLVLLPGCSAHSAATTAERIRRDVNGFRFTTSAGPVRISVSAGCSGGCDLEPAALLRLADAGLYRAKAGGRNRVEVAASSDRTGQPCAGEGR